MGHAGGEGKVLDGDGAQDTAANTQIQVLADALLGADAAAHFDVQAALFRDGGNALKIRQGAVLGAVQIDNVEIFSSGGDEISGHGAGVLAVDGHFVVIALIQADHLPAGQVDGGKNLHMSAPL